MLIYVHINMHTYMHLYICMCMFILYIYMYIFSKYLKWTIYKIWNRFSSFESPTQFQEKWKIIKTQQSKMAGDKFLRNVTNKMKI